MPDLCGLIGKDLRNSLSPFIHQNAQRLLNRQIDYQVFELEAEKLEEFLDDFWQQGALGLNVTSPYKEHVAKLIASPLKSVNTLYRGQNGWLGASSDILGLEKALELAKRSLFSYDVIICLGSGGVIKALLEHLDTWQAKTVKLKIFCRNLKKAELRLTPKAKNIETQFYEFKAACFEKELAKTTQKSLVVHATTATAEELWPFAKILLASQIDVLDLCYGKKAVLHALLRKRLFWQQDGLAMLIFQALLAQKYWWQEVPKYQLLAAKILPYLNSR